MLGRHHNVVGAQVLADYLQQTIERIAQDTARERGVNVFSQPMIAFREGMADRLCDRLAQLRYERLEAERRKNEQAQAPSGGMALSVLVQDEADLNNDFIMGYEPGTTARRRQESDALWQKQKAEYEQFLTTGTDLIALKTQLEADLVARRLGIGEALERLMAQAFPEEP